ncbi:MAG: hypothetical protein A2176_01500 [Spirochaetes bacterium RBG_13_51_14]|nr:MAG: hypothetical protein A2176_01500 [Spirochaetes bacterium RBG_13_51_14]
MTAFYPDATGIDTTEEKIRTFSMAVEQSPASVVITDRHGTIEYVNPKFSRLTGYSAAEALGKNPRILKSGAQPPEFYRVMWETISAGRDWRGEFHNLKKNGESYWESASISPILDEKGEITHYVAVKEDITERKMAEEALRTSEEMLRKKNQDMERELKYAQVVIGRLLPEDASAPDRLEVDFRHIPLDEIGGDFFSFNTLHDKGFGVFIGDVAGHGVSAALFLALVKSVTERLNNTRGESPSLYIKDLNGNLVEGNVTFFLTALYGYFNITRDTAEFSFAKGGHTPPVLFRPADGSTRLLKSSGMPVGLSVDAEFQEVHASLLPGDRIYLYTDGIIEARNDGMDMLEPEGLLSIIGRTGAKNLHESLDFILEEVSRFRGAEPPEDDVVLIGFEVLK